MKIDLNRSNDAVLVEASNEHRHKVMIEGNKNNGGNDTAQYPTGVFMMSQTALYRFS